MDEMPTIEELQKKIIKRLLDDEVKLIDHQESLHPLIGGAVEAVEGRNFEQVKYYADLLKDWLTESYIKRSCLTDTIQMLYYFAVLGNGNGEVAVTAANDAE